MPSTYARNLAALKLEILARVAAGERLRGVCGGPGMPCPHTVQNWAAGDAAFGAALARGRAGGPERARGLLAGAAGGVRPGAGRPDHRGAAQGAEAGGGVGGGPGAAVPAHA